jgi:hypothetical protein
MGSTLKPLGACCAHKVAATVQRARQISLLTFIIPELLLEVLREWKSTGKQAVARYRNSVVLNLMKTQ